MRRRVVGAVVVVLAAVLALMIRDASVGGDWPGWDEGWALVVFPLGIPLALYAERALRGQPRPLRGAAYASLAVWAWGAAVFAAWHVLGS